MRAGVESGRPLPRAGRIRGLDEFVKRAELYKEQGQFVLAETRRACLASMLRTLATWGTAVALAWLLPRLALAQEGPDVEQLHLAAGARAPFAGHLIIDEAYARLVRETAAAQAVIPILQTDLRQAREDRDACYTGTADRLEDAAARVAAISARLDSAADRIAVVPVEQPAVPSRATWAGLGAGAVLVCGVAAFVPLADVGTSTRGALAGVAGGLCGAGVVALGWALE